MYTLTRLISAKDLILHQVPALVVSLLIAETLYRFGSFALEAVAFLATWYVADFALDQFAAHFRSRSKR